MKIIFDDRMLNITWKSNGEDKSFLVKNVDDIELDDATLNQIKTIVEKIIAESPSSFITEVNLTDNEKENISNFINQNFQSDDSENFEE